MREQRVETNFLVPQGYRKRFGLEEPGHGKMEIEADGERDQWAVWFRYSFDGDFDGEGNMSRSERYGWIQAIMEQIRFECERRS